MTPRAVAPRGAGDIETPALLLHLDVVERNLARMAARARRLGVALRPHAKTHKCPELGRRQLAHGAVGLTVATLAEAEAFVRAGFTDLTWAFPIDPTHIAHARRLARRATLRVVTDDLETARALAGTRLHVWLKVDCGYHRAGVDPDVPYAMEVARELGRQDGLVFDGLLTHSGHAYKTRNKKEAAKVAEQERLSLVRFAQRLRTAGITVHALSVGSTPAMSAVADLTGITEARPGNYVFHDRTISVASVSQEHGVVRGPVDVLNRFGVGDRLEIVPNHSCLTVAHYDHYHVMRDGRELDQWRIERGR